MPMSEEEKILRNREKALDYYYRNKEKVYARLKRWRKENPEKAKALVKRFHRSEKGKAALKKSAAKQKDKENWQKRYLAMNALNAAIARKDIIRMPCEICAAPRGQAHHHMGYDEENWLNVMWLCPKHHYAEHHKQ